VHHADPPALQLTGGQHRRSSASFARATQEGDMSLPKASRALPARARRQRQGGRRSEEGEKDAWRYGLPPEPPSTGGDMGGRGDRFNRGATKSCHANNF
jgi:hypothetical protein